MNLLQQLEHEQVERLAASRAVPKFEPGDTVRVSLKVVEGERERIQAFEGVCIARKNAGVNSNFTLRKISYGEGVERVFPLYSPRLRSRFMSCSTVSTSASVPCSLPNMTKSCATAWLIPLRRPGTATRLG